VTITIYVEGGGDRNKATTARCRQGFAEYCRRVAPGRPQPKIVACGGRGQAFDRFKTEVGRQKTGEQCVLLVDSESPVKSGITPATHLHQRDGWSFANLPTQQVFLMVEAMEAWLLADRSALAAFYGAEFRPNALPYDERHVEAIPKDDLVASLQRATVAVKTKGRYHKTGHAFSLLAEIDPHKVEAASPHAAAFHLFLLAPTVP